MCSKLANMQVNQLVVSAVYKKIRQRPHLRAFNSIDTLIDFCTQGHQRQMLGWIQHAMAQITVTQQRYAILEFINVAVQLIGQKYFDTDTFNETEHGEAALVCPLLSLTDLIFDTVQCHLPPSLENYLRDTKVPDGVLVQPMTGIGLLFLAFCFECKTNAVRPVEDRRLNDTPRCRLHEELSGILLPCGLYDLHVPRKMNPAKTVYSFVGRTTPLRNTSFVV